MARDETTLDPVFEGEFEGEPEDGWDKVDEDGEDEA